MSALRVLCALSLGACTLPPRAQVLVRVDADPDVIALTHRLHVRIWGRVDGQPFHDADGSSDGYEEATRTPPFPWVVAIRPVDDDPRRLFRFEAIAREADGTLVAVTRLISGYAPNRVLTIDVRLLDSCIGVPCEDLDSSCRDGRCVPIPMFDPGTERYSDGGACVPGAEACDRMDNDCDVRVDEGFDTRTDRANCGACGVACPGAPRARAACEDGACALVCDRGFDDCDGDPSNGCERSLVDAASCGACGVVCSASDPFCEDGLTPRCVASCGPGLTACGTRCVDLATSIAHCGRCDAACPERSNASESCVDGACAYACDAGWASCDGNAADEDGCETDLLTSALHCGACDRPCTSDACRDRSCTDGVCIEGADRCPMDAGMRDAGGPCGGRTCSAGQSCCGGTTCCTGGCCGMSCCPPDAGAPDAGLCGERMCRAGQRCCGDTSCCSGACCGTECCRDAGGPPDAGDACGGSCAPGTEVCCGGACCEGIACCAGSCCVDGGGMLPADAGAPTADAGAGSPEPCSAMSCAGTCCPLPDGGTICCVSGCGPFGCPTGS